MVLPCALPQSAVTGNYSADRYGNLPPKIRFLAVVQPFWTLYSKYFTSQELYTFFAVHIPQTGLLEEFLIVFQSHSKFHLRFLPPPPTSWHNTTPHSKVGNHYYPTNNKVKGTMRGPICSASTLDFLHGEIQGDCQGSRAQCQSWH